MRCFCCKKKTFSEKFTAHYCVLHSSVLYFGHGGEEVNTQLRKGVIELCILALIAQKDMYGYDIVLSDGEVHRHQRGTVYPILRRLTKDGYFATYLVESDSGPARKYYTMTDRGRIYLKKNILDWEEIMLLVNSILKGEENDEQK